MTPPHIPPPRIDLATLPPLLSTGDADSFARFTLKVRDPQILQNLEDAAWISPDLKRSMRKFRDEVLQGEIRTLREDTPDRDFWSAAVAPYVGRSWLDVPWYFAETFFYRRILEIVGYFHLGAWHERDPFGPVKDAELDPLAAPKRVGALLESLGDSQRTEGPHPNSYPHPLDSPLPKGEGSELSMMEQFELYLYAALWGNRVDLSYNVEEKVGRAARLEDERANLVVDDAPQVWEYFKAHPLKQLVYVADNAGTELAHDLAFIEFLLRSQLVQNITLHLKPQPFFVSDAMPQDVERTLSAFDRANERTLKLAAQLRAHIAAKRLVLRVHWFYPTSLHYFEMPEELLAMMRAADFVIFKGDVNYRRLVGDAHWKPTIAFDYTTRYFPAPFVSLRTLKAELIVGLKPGQAEELSKQDREWRVNGKRGVVQANLKRAG